MLTIFCVCQWKKDLSVAAIYIHTSIYVGFFSVGCCKEIKKPCSKCFAKTRKYQGKRNEKWKEKNIVEFSPARICIQLRNARTFIESYLVYIIISAQYAFFCIGLSPKPIYRHLLVRPIAWFSNNFIIFLLSSFFIFLFWAGADCFFFSCFIYILDNFMYPCYCYQLPASIHFTSLSLFRWYFVEKEFSVHKKYLRGKNKIYFISSTWRLPASFFFLKVKEQNSMKIFVIPFGKKHSTLRMKERIVLLLATYY